MCHIVSCLERLLFSMSCFRMHISLQNATKSSPTTSSTCITHRVLSSMPHVPGGMPAFPCVPAYVHVCVCVRACVRACVGVGVHARVCVCVCQMSLVLASNIVGIEARPFSPSSFSPGHHAGGSSTTHGDAGPAAGHPQTLIRWRRRRNDRGSYSVGGWVEGRWAARSGGGEAVARLRWVNAPLPPPCFDGVIVLSLLPASRGAQSLEALNQTFGPPQEHGGPVV